MRSSGDFLDMYLCAYVRSGSLHAFCGEQSADAAAGQLVRMDCRSREKMTPSKFLSMNF